jgi:hypothetical protein
MKLNRLVNHLGRWSTALFEWHPAPDLPTFGGRPRIASASHRHPIAIGRPSGSDRRRLSSASSGGPSMSLIIPLIIRTIRRDPSASVWIEGPSQLSRSDPSGSDQIDAEHQATDLAVRPWRRWPLPHLAVPFLVGHRGGGGRLSAGGPAWRCGRSARGCRPRRCPQRPGACGCRCPQAASTVRASGPSLSAGCGT